MYIKYKKMSPAIFIYSTKTSKLEVLVSRACNPHFRTNSIYNRANRTSLWIISIFHFSSFASSNLNVWRVYRQNNTNKVRTRGLFTELISLERESTPLEPLHKYRSEQSDVLKMHKKFPARHSPLRMPGGNSRYRRGEGLVIPEGNTRKRLVLVIKSLVGFPAILQSSFWFMFLNRLRFGTEKRKIYRRLFTELHRIGCAARHFETSDYAPL